MKPSPDDPRLSSLLLGELPADEAAELQRASAADPALGLALRELETTSRLLADALSPEAMRLHPHQRERVRQAARQADSAAQPLRLTSRKPLASRLRPLLAAAAAIALGWFALSRIPASRSSTATRPDAPIPLEIALLPAPASPQASAANPQAASTLRATAASSLRHRSIEQANEAFLRAVSRSIEASPPPAGASLPGLTPLPAQEAALQPRLPLPILAGRGSLSWVCHAIREQRRKPAPNAVRLEEILNHFPLQTSGPRLSSLGVSLGSEVIPCPWSPSRQLAVITLAGDAKHAREVELAFLADPSATLSYRLLGFAQATDAPRSPPATRLPPRSRTTLVVEITPTSSSPGPSGKLCWKINGETAPDLPLPSPTPGQSSPDARFASLVCAFSLWLANPADVTIDAEMVAALAREYATQTTAPDRLEFLDLIDRSLHL